MELRLSCSKPSIWMHVIHVLHPMNAVNFFHAMTNISIIFIDTYMNDKTLQNIEILYR